jgi:hypothetical protein
MALSKITTESLLDGEITLAKFANLGSDGQVLTSTGGSSPPAFEAAAGGAWAVVASGGAGSNVASLEYTSIGTKDIWMRVKGMTSTSSAQGLRMQISQSSSFVTSGTGYNYATQYFEGSDSIVTANAQDQSFMSLSGSNRMPATGGDTVRAYSADIYIYDPSGTSKHTMVYSHIKGTNDGKGITDQASNSFDANTSAIDGLKLYGSGYNFNYDSYLIMELN